MEERKQLKNQMKQIDKQDGFNTLVSDFKVIEHLRANCFTSKTIDNTNVRTFYNELKALYDFIQKINFKNTVEIDNLIQNKTRLNHYISETFEKSGVEYQKSKSYFEKWLEQRIRNNSLEKTMDNFRYMILRASGLAGANQYPFGIDINNNGNTIRMGAFDRSNLTEFEIINCLEYLNPQDMNMSQDDYNELLRNRKKDSLKKQNIIDVINHIKEEYPETYPQELDNVLERIKGDGVSTEYFISDILSEDDINNVLDRHNACRILIGHREVISKELENLNNKNNPWQEINFLFQNLNSKTHLKFVDEAIVAMERDDYEDCRKWHKYLTDRAPEYCMIPVIANDVFKPSEFTSSTDAIDNYKKLANFFEGKSFHSETGDRWLYEKYKKLTEIPSYKYSLVNDFYSIECEELWNITVSKLKRLKQVIQKLKRKNLSTHQQSIEISNIILKKIDALWSRKFGYNVYALLAAIFAGDGKTLKSSSDNVVKAFELFLDTYFGNDVFEVDSKKVTYTIKDDEFLKVITDEDSGGYATSHTGRAEYILPKLKTYKEKYQDFENYQGTNEELVERQRDEINQLLGVTRFGWREDTVTGNVVYCGWDGTTTINTSWEHIDNTTQKVGAIRATETNSSDGAKTKPFKTTSEYFEYILEQQDSPKVKKDYDDEIERLMVKLQLEKIIKHFKDEESK